MAAECRRVGARVVVGGPEPRAEAEEYLARDTDVVVIGEGEVTLAELLPLLLARPGRRDWSEVAGIVYRSESDRVVRTRPARAHPQPRRAALARSRGRGHPRVPERLARAPRLRLHLAADRARLPVHVPLVQPVGLRRDAPPALRGRRRRRGAVAGRALPSGPALVRGRRVHDPSRVRARAGGRDGAARAARPVRVHLACRPPGRGHRRRAGPPGLPAAVDRLGKRLAGACSTPWTAG